MRGSLLFALCGIVVAATTGSAIATSTGGAEGWSRHLACYVAAGASWAAMLALLGRLPRGRADVAVLFALAIAMRVPAWIAPPVHSDDVFRFLWDGRVQRAGINPYLHAPADPALASLRDGEAPIAAATGGERAAARPTWKAQGVYPRINNRDLPTIYPPGAQILFLVAALPPLPPLAALKLVLAICDLGVIALLVALLRRRGADPRWAAAWAMSPLVVIELGQDAHLDALPILALVGALYAWEAGRRTLAGVMLGLSAATKLITAPLLVAVAGRRGDRARVTAAMLVSMALLALPYLGAGRAMLGSTGEFARRWRANDGVYALAQAAADRVVCRALDAPIVERGDGKTPCDKPLDLWPHTTLAGLISGREHRAAVYPDELASLLARGLIALGLFAIVVGVAVASARDRLAPVGAAEWILGALLLGTPALQPWYATWLLPLLAISRRPAWIWLAATVPLGYVPMAAWLTGGAWRDPAWTRVLEHGLCLALLALGAAARARAIRRSARPSENRPLGFMDPSPAPDTIRPATHASNAHRSGK